MCVYIYIYIYVHTYMYTYAYIYIYAHYTHIVVLTILNTLNSDIINNNNNNTEPTCLQMESACASASSISRQFVSCVKVLVASLMWF